MAKINQAPLFEPHSAQYVLGSLMHQPKMVLNTSKYLLNSDDFSNKVYEIIFYCIYNLAYDGAEKITPLNIDVYLNAYPTQHESFNQLNGNELTALIYELTEDFDEAQFDLYYARVKKFSVLRELAAKGIDIDEFYNPSFLNTNEQEEKFNNLTIEDILKKVRNRIQIVENHNVLRKDSTAQSAGTNIQQLLQTLSEQPEVGVALQGDMLNYATRGARKGKMYLYSAPSGGGKTRTMVGNACSIAYPYIENGQKHIPKHLNPVLFIATEMQADEIQTLILSWISGVNEEHILLNTCTEDEKFLVQEAAKIMIEYSENFIIECIPNPSIQSLKALITNYIINDKIEYIFYDYIFTSPGLVGEFQKSGLREDVVLMMLSNTLKEIAAENNVFVMTGTQVSGEWDKKGVRNANMIRGAKAIADKVDVGMIGVRPPKDELAMVQTYCEQMHLPTPNLVIDIYKNRRGKLCDVKLFRYFSYGTCRTKDIVVVNNQTYDPETIDTKLSYEPERIEPLCAK